MTNIATLTRAFEALDADAARWTMHPDGDFDVELPDCDVMAKRYTAFAIERGHNARTVECHPPQPEPWYDGHWFTVIDGQAIDWTARQFYNVADDSDEWLDPNDIPTPLVFAWPGHYPIAGMHLIETGGK